MTAIPSAKEVIVTVDFVTNTIFTTGNIADFHSNLENKVNADLTIMSGASAGLSVAGLVSSQAAPGASLGALAFSVSLLCKKNELNQDITLSDVLGIVGPLTSLVGDALILTGVGAPIGMGVKAVGIGLSIGGFALRLSDYDVPLIGPGSRDRINGGTLRPYGGLDRNGDYRFAHITRFDPLTLDLDGDGIETVGTNGWAGSLFDMDNDGIRTATGWIKSDDGLLVFDRNGNGLIDNGTELFGDHTPISSGGFARHGFAALADLDSNGDGVISALDANFAYLKVWRDLNQDGVSSTDELFTLSELGIASLNLNYADTNQILNGDNVLAQIGSYTLSDGTVRQMGDVNLAADSLHTEYTDHIELTSEQAMQPNVQGIGRLRDLREAAALSGELADVLTRYRTAATRAEQMGLLDELLLAWAKTDPKWKDEWELSFSSGGIEDSNSNNVIWLQPGQQMEFGVISDAMAERLQNSKLLMQILDAFSGEETSNLYFVNDNTIEIIESTYAELAAAVYDKLLPQTRLRDYLDKIGLDINADGLQMNFSTLDTLCAEKYVTDREQAFIDLADLLAMNNGVMASNGWTQGLMLFANWVEQANRDGVLQSYYQLGLDQTIAKFAMIGSGDSDKLTGANSTRIVIGLDGHDTLSSNEKNTLLIGGAGNDSLTGLGILLGGEGNDHLLHYSESGYADGGAGDDILEGSGLLIGGDGNDTITGYGILKGDAGDDNITGTNSQTIMFGGDGDDTLTGQNGGIYNGGTGNDIIDARHRYYTDIIEFNLGDGQDTILTYDKKYENQYGLPDDSKNSAYGGKDDERIKDIIRFGPDVTPDMISYRRIGNDLIVLVGNGGDQLTIKDYYPMNNYQTIDRFEFADGTVWENILTQANFYHHGSDGNDTLTGWAHNDVIYGGKGNDKITDTYGNNYLDGGEGDDTITGCGTITGGKGNDTIILSTSGSPNKFRYLFNTGDGKDVISVGAWGGQQDGTIAFGAGITAAMIAYGRTGNDLVVFVGKSGDQLTIKNYFSGLNFASGQYVNRFEFADGTVWEDIRQQPLIQYYDQSTKAALGLTNSITGTPWDDWITGSSDAETIDDRWGYNVINAGAGNDTILAHGDVTGGKGNDSITLYRLTQNGGIVENTVRFNLGDGQDSINTNYVYASEADGPADKLLFGAAVTPSIVKLSSDGSSLTIKVGTSGDQISLYNYFNGYSSLRHFEFADGTVWGFNDILDKALAKYYGSSADKITSTQSNSRIYGGAGNDTITAQSGGMYAYLDGGAGNDTIKGKGTINGGTGTDTIYLSGNAYGNVLMFNKGDGRDTIYVSDNYSAYHNDKIVFGQQVTTDMLSYSRQQNDLIVKIGTTDQMTLKDYFLNDDKQLIRRFEFSDGTAFADIREQPGVFALINHAPVVNNVPGEQNAIKQQPWQLSLTSIFKDPDNNVLRYTVTLADGSALPSWLKLDAQTGLLSGTPTDKDQGELNLKLTAIDPGGLSVSHTVSLKVQGTNEAPRVKNTYQSAPLYYKLEEGQTFNLTLPTDLFTDPNNDTLSIDVVGLFDGSPLPDWISYDAATRTLSGIPPGSEPVIVKIIASDGKGGTAVTWAALHTLRDAASITDANYVRLDPVNGAYFDNSRMTSGNDYIDTNGQGIGYLTPGYGDDVVIASGGSVYGGAGNDRLYGLDWSTILSGDVGDDLLIAYGAGSNASAGSGKDHLIGFNGATLNGGWEGSLIDLYGSGFVNGGGGDDLIRIHDVYYGATVSVRGGAGNDTIISNSTYAATYDGEEGDDIIQGGSGNERLIGGKGNDTYRFQLGGGQDVIDNQYQLKTDFDQLQFGEGINANQLWFERTGDDLKVSIIGTNDSITVENWYGEVHDWYYNYQDMTHQLDQFTLSDGRALVASQVDSLVQAMASFAPPVPGQTVLPDAYQSTLNSVIASSWR